MAGKVKLPGIGRQAKKGAKQLRQGAKRIRRDLRDGVRDIVDQIDDGVDKAGRRLRGHLPIAGPKPIELLNSVRPALAASLRQRPPPPVPGARQLERIRSSAMRLVPVGNFLRSAMRELHDGPHKAEMSAIMIDVLTGKAAWSAPWEFADECLGYDLATEAARTAGVPEWAAFSVTMGLGGDAAAAYGGAGGIFFAQGPDIAAMANAESPGWGFSIGATAGWLCGYKLGFSGESQAGFYLIHAERLHGYTISFEVGAGLGPAVDGALQFDFGAFCDLAKHDRLTNKFGVAIGLGAGTDIQFDVAMYGTVILAWNNSALKLKTPWGQCQIFSGLVPS